MKLPELIENWKDFTKFWSVRLSALGSFLLAFTEVAPHAFLDIWTTLPASIVDNFPPGLVRVVGYVLIGSGIVARVVKQQKLNKSGVQ